MINKPEYYLDKMASNTDVFTEESSDKEGFTFSASTDDSIGLEKMIDIDVYKEFEDEFIRLEHEKRTGTFMLIGKGRPICLCMCDERKRLRHYDIYF